MCELTDDDERCRALETLPPDLTSTYEAILRRVDEKPIPVQRLVQRTLRWLVVVRGVITRTGFRIDALKEALSIKEGIARLRRDAVPNEFDILRSCSSLVRRSASGEELELAHFTVKEFLLGIDRDSRFSAYRVDVEQSEVELGKVCLTYLTLQDFNSRASWSREAESKRDKEYAFRTYAIQSWLFHAGGRQGDPGLLALIKKLLDPSKPGTFTTWTHDYRFSSLCHEDSVYPDEPLYQQDTHAAVEMDTPLHYASGFALPEICKWLLDCGCNVNHIGRFGTPINYVIRQPALLAFESKGWTKKSVLKVMDILLEAGADPNVRRSDGSSPLHDARADRDVILRLLQKGARYKDGKAYNPPSWTGSGYANKILRDIGRENFHEDDYAFLLECAIEESTIEENANEEKFR